MHITNIDVYYSRMYGVVHFRDIKCACEFCESGKN